MRCGGTGTRRGTIMRYAGTCGRLGRPCDAQGRAVATGDRAMCTDARPPRTTVRCALTGGRRGRSCDAKGREVSTGSPAMRRIAQGPCPSHELPLGAHVPISPHILLRFVILLPRDFPNTQPRCKRVRRARGLRIAQQVMGRVRQVRCAMHPKHMKPKHFHNSTCLRRQ